MRRWIVLLAFVAGCIVVSKVLLEDVLGLRLGPLATVWLAEAGPGGAVMVVALLAVDLFLPIPSSLVMVLSGAAFGVPAGTLLSLIGSIGGQWIGFELVRRYGQRAARRMVGDDGLERLSRVCARHGMAAVAVTRALPVVMETMSVVAALCSMPRSTFLLGSLAGTLPVALVYAYAGAMSRETGSLVPAVVILVAVAGLAWVWYRARFEQNESTPRTESSFEASRD